MLWPAEHGVYTVSVSALRAVCLFTTVLWFLHLTDVVQFVAYGFAAVTAAHVVGLLNHFVSRERDVPLIGIKLLMNIKDVVVFGIIFQSMLGAAASFKAVVKTKGSGACLL